VPVHDLRRSADVVEVDARLRVEVEAQLVRDVGLVVEVRPELRLPALGEEDLAGARDGDLPPRDLEEGARRSPHGAEAVACATNSAIAAVKACRLSSQA
jgi:hypothetical protein